MSDPAIHDEANKWIVELSRYMLVLAADKADDELVPYRQWVLDWAEKEKQVRPPAPELLAEFNEYVTAGQLRIKCLRGLTLA